MTKQEQIKALAELDGFKYDGNVGFIKHERFHTIEGQFEDNESCGGIGGGYEPALPRYLTSYDAIIPLIQKHNTLELMQDVARWLPANVPTSLHATTTQLCEALLRATGKWKE